ncbi:MAG: hypothetical protein II857_02095 [Selenomonadaceae bacterium]|nr:hypothetical protein [Selenomonadaceae bacterium]
MKISVDEKKAEAIRRMELLGIYPETIRHFKKHNLVSVSEPPLGAFFWARDNDLEFIKDFEAKHDALVYMVVRTYYEELGKLDSYLFVGDYREEWKHDWQGLADGEAFAYVRNHDCDWCSEFGTIGIKRTIAAGLVRTW